MEALGQGDCGVDWVPMSSDAAGRFDELVSRDGRLR